MCIPNFFTQVLTEVIYNKSFQAVSLLIPPDLLSMEIVIKGHEVNYLVFKKRDQP